MTRDPDEGATYRRGRGTAVSATDDPLAGFLAERLTEDLALLWHREAERADRGARPGLAAQLEALDEQLLTLQAGRLPGRRELRVLLFGYGSHPDYDPTWTDRLLA